MKTFLTGIKKYILTAIVVVIFLIIGYFLWFSGGNGGEETLTIQPSDFVQTVSVAGKVTPAQSVELGFNRSGKVVAVPVIVGQKVAAGQTIASLDAHDAEIDLENAKIALAKITENSNSASGLVKNYEDGLAVVNQIFIDFPPVIDGLNNILNNYTVSTYKINLPDSKSSAYYKQAFDSFWQAKRAYDQTVSDYQKLSRPISNESTVMIVNETYQTVQFLSQALKDAYTYTDYLYNRETNPSNRAAALVTDRSNINTWIGTVDTSLSNLGSKRDTIKNIPLDIKTQELIVRQKENDYSNYFLRAPFAGTITRLDIKTGEIASAGVASVSMINAGLFQIESYVPEISIANIKIGNRATITLDAYGSENVFEAKVLTIDPAETIRDGVSTYKVKLQFITDDPRIKSGMTANLEITTVNKPQVLSVPASAILTKNNQKFLQLKRGQQIIDQPVTIGLVGALGQTEILTGLSAGDVVIVNPKPE